MVNPAARMRLVVVALVALLGYACAAHRGNVSSVAGTAEGVNWPGYGRAFDEQHFSPLTQINSSNVSRLSLEWSLDLEPGNSVTAPIAVDGVIYFVTGLSIVRAVEAKSGRVLWRFDPKVAEAAGHKLRLAWGTRGLASWRDRIFVGTLDGRLIAINAETGTEAWHAMTVSPDDTNVITGAPRILDDKVIIGFGGADLGPARGYVSTYDAESGKLLWRWYTVPGNPADGFENDAMAAAAKTWVGEWWKYGGGGTVWNAMSYDPETNTVFIGTGNGSPWNHKARSEGRGDNLYLCSIVALDANAGTYKWHYQVNPGESWDYNAAMDMALAQISVAGRMRKVLLTAPKNGFFYVIDRTDGRLISAEPFAKVTWASKIDLDSGRPAEDPAARYPNGSEFILWPSSLGAHGWFPMAFNPAKGLAYIPVTEKAQSWKDDGVENERWLRNAAPFTSRAAARVNAFPKTDDPRDGTSRLEAWNVATQQRVWGRPTPGLSGGGVLATAGNLVFQGRLDGRFNAYAADTGEQLWTFDAHTSVVAPPISYSVDGRQYISVLSGMGTSLAVFATPAWKYNTDYRTQPRRLLTFAIDGRAQLPNDSPAPLAPIVDADFHADSAKSLRGAAVYRRCTSCHGVSAVAGGNAPDLRASPFITSAESFNAVLKEGALVSAGMPKFDELTEIQIDDLRQYLRAEADRWRRHAADEPMRSLTNAAR